MAETIDAIEQQTELCKVCEEAIAKLSLEALTFNYGPVDDGIELHVTVPVWNCDACGEQYLDGAAEDIKHAAICAHLGRLTPEDIRSVRVAFGMLQDGFAKFTGYGIASIKRWESGAQIQSESVDNHLRLIRSLGAAEVAKRTSPPPSPEYRTAISASARKHAQHFHLRPSIQELDALAA